jgi:acetoin utilization deacetylase AcuC-like enzyme
MLVGYYDETFLSHHEWRHPERPERLVAVRRVLEESGLNAEIEWRTVRPAAQEAIFSVHEEQIWRQVQRLAAQGGGRIDADTYVNAHSFDAACLAAGAAIQAMESALAGDTLPFALVRPPGHHATPTRSMGFCLFNNIAVAAQMARTHHGIERVAILDWDVHHGNGTQDIFYEDPNVLFISTHQYPFYPGTGHWEQMGRGDGYGTTLNIPLRAGCGDQVYTYLFDEMVLPALRAFQPGLLLQGYHHLAGRLRDITKELNIPMAMILEGGYDLDAIGYGWYASLLGLLGRPLSADPLGPAPAIPEPVIEPLAARIRESHPLLR